MTKDLSVKNKSVTSSNIPEPDQDLIAITNVKVTNYQTLLALFQSRLDYYENLAKPDAGVCENELAVYRLMADKCRNVINSIAQFREAEAILKKGLEKTGGFIK